MNNTFPRDKANGHRVWENRRLVILSSLMLVAVVGLLGMINIRQSAILYGDIQPRAIPSEVCPGDEFTYQVNIEIKDPDTVVLLTEDWCKLSTNICPREFTYPPVYHNSKEPNVVKTTATRVVPAAVPPGDWEFRHCNTATSDKGTSVSCYYVPVTILDCSEKPE